VKPICTPLDERKCILLKMNFSLYVNVKCTMLYESLCYLSIIWKRPNMFKSIELVKSDSKHMINKLGCYVQKAFEIRSQIMYNNWSRYIRIYNMMFIVYCSHLVMRLCTCRSYFIDFFSYINFQATVCRYMYLHKCAIYYFHLLPLCFRFEQG